MYNKIQFSLDYNCAFTDLIDWAKLTLHITKHYSKIIAFRGAGSNNGMDEIDMNAALEMEIIPKISQHLRHGPVAIMYDGNEDNPEKPDIGRIVGRLREYFKGLPFEQILFIAVQKDSWYSPTSPNGNLSNAEGLPYVTYVFPKGSFKGDHNNFTQSEDFVQTAQYEQWYDLTPLIETTPLETFGTI